MNRTISKTKVFTKQQPEHEDIVTYTKKKKNAWVGASVIMFSADFVGYWMCGIFILGLGKSDRVRKCRVEWAKDEL